MNDEMLVFADGAEGYKRCENCDAMAFEPKASEMAGTEGVVLCSDCRRVCECCRLVGSAEEDYSGGNATCRHCEHYQARAS